MMSKTKAEDIAYRVSTVILNTFLEDIKDGIDGFSKERTFLSSIENATLKEFYRLKEGKKEGYLYPR